MTKLSPELVLQNFAARLVSAWCSDAEQEEQIAPAASTLSCFLSSSVDGVRTSTVTLPALEIRPSDRRGSLFSQVHQQMHHPPGTNRKRRALRRHRAALDGPPPASIDDVLSKNLGKTRRFDKMDVPQAPSTILGNLATSFQLMIDDALRQTALTLMRRSLLQAKAGRIDADTARAHGKILKLLLPPSSPEKKEAGGKGDGGGAAKKKKRRKTSPVRIAAAATNWQTLPPSSSDESSHHRPTSVVVGGGGHGHGHGHGHAPYAPPRFVLPLIFEAVIDVDVLEMGGPSLTLRVPGTISAKFNRLTSRIETASVVLDTDALYGLLRRRTDELVARAAEVAFMIASRLLRGDAAVVGEGGGSKEPKEATSDGSLHQEEGDDSAPAPLRREDEQTTTFAAAARRGKAEAEAEAYTADDDDDAVRMPPPPPRPPRSFPPAPPQAEACSCCHPQKRQRLSSTSPSNGQGTKVLVANPAA